MKISSHECWMSSQSTRHSIQLLICLLNKRLTTVRGRTWKKLTHSLQKFKRELTTTFCWHTMHFFKKRVITNHSAQAVYNFWSKITASWKCSSCCIPQLPTLQLWVRHFTFSLANIWETSSFFFLVLRQYRYSSVQTNPAVLHLNVQFSKYSIKTVQLNTWRQSLLRKWTLLKVIPFKVHWVLPAIAFNYSAGSEPENLMTLQSCVQMLIKGHNHMLT